MYVYIYIYMISETHAEGPRSPRRQTHISVMLGLLSQSTSLRFPL